MTKPLAHKVQHALYEIDRVRVVLQRQADVFKDQRDRAERRALALNPTKIELIERNDEQANTFGYAYDTLLDIDVLLVSIRTEIENQEKEIK